MNKTFDITGMTCSACSAHVQKAVEKIEGVSKAPVNLLTATMKVAYDENRVDESAIIAAVKRAGYGAAPRGGASAAEKETGGRAAADRQYAVRLWVSVAFTLILMYFSMGAMIGLPQPSFMRGESGAVAFALTQLLLCLPVIFVNFAYFKNGFKRLFTLSPNMDSLIALGSAVSFLYGVFALYRMSYGMGTGDYAVVHRYMHELYFESAAMILTLITLGKFFEERSKRRTTGAVEKLKNLVPPTAILLSGGAEMAVDSASLKKGDVIALKAGAKVPCDGEILVGEIFVDESAVTGESMPVRKGGGEAVTGGTLVTGGYGEVRVFAVGEDSVIASIIRLVQDANADKAPIAKLADKISGVFVPVVIAIAALTFAVWMIVGKSAEFAMSLAVSVLVISCPCALGLATPVAVMVGTGKGAENGVLFKSGEALQTLHSVKTVIFDKTGTITLGRPAVTDFVTDLKGGEKRELLTAAAALESLSEHPLAKAVAVYGAKEAGESTVRAEDFKTYPGMGVGGSLNGKEYLIGNAALMEKFSVKTDDKFIALISRLSGEGKTAVLIAEGGAAVACAAVADVIKPASAGAIGLLKRQGIHTVMLTGDNLVTARAVADKCGVDEVIAEVLPEEKEEAVRRFMKRGVTAMVGDGINDAPALTRADVGIAVGAGSDIALDSADVILMSSDLYEVATAVKLSKATIANVKENLFWAFFYNALCIPLAAGVLFYWLGWKLNPMIAAAAMSLSSLFVVGNALRLKFFKPLRAAGTTAAAPVLSSAGAYQAVSEKAAPLTNGGETAGCPITAAPYGKDGTRAEGESVSGKADISKSENSKKENNDMKLKMFIDGMTCGHCKAAVERAIKAGGAAAEVNLDEKCAYITAPEGLDVKKLESAMAALDYTVVRTEKL